MQKNNFFSSKFKLGVLGGGQLGRMLISETQKLDIHTAILENSFEAPCAVIANTFVLGDITNFEDVYNFGKKVDVLTIEIEHVNIEALFKLEEEGLKIFPQPRVLQLIKHKGLQKDFYKENNIPTATFKRFNSLEELIKEQHQFPIIWKSAEFGYDGNGVKKLNSVAELKVLPKTPCIIEELVDFKTELAVIVARNENGEMATYPVVEMEFNPTSNQVEYVLCPARISSAIAEKAQKVALKVAKSFQHVGLLAVELFVTKKDEILVNEVAPRPHNSGHFSIEASYTNQFEQHIRAILNLPLGCTESKLPSVMVNLVGSEGYIGNVYYEKMEEILSLKGVTPHIYGKKTTKPNRKMGHITVVHQEIEKARKLAEKVKNKIVVKSLSV